MVGDGFGMRVVSEGNRVYVSAPYRNEQSQHSGAIFVYELIANRSAIGFREIAKVTLAAPSDYAYLGLDMTVRNRIIYTHVTSNGTPIGVVAFHPPIRLTPWRFSQTFGIDFTEVANAATWETSVDLNAGWRPLTGVDPTTSFQLTTDQTAVFFRIVSPSAF